MSDFKIPVCKRMSYDLQSIICSPHRSTLCPRGTAIRNVRIPLQPCLPTPRTSPTCFPLNIPEKRSANMRGPSRLGAPRVQFNWGATRPIPHIMSPVRASIKCLSALFTSMRFSSLKRGLQLGTELPNGIEPLVQPDLESPLPLQLPHPQASPQAADGG